MLRYLTTATWRAAALPVLLALFGLLLAGCEVADPALPSFQTRVAVPLGEERMDIADAIDDEDYLYSLPDGTLGFSVDGDPDTVALDLDVAADIPAQTVRGDLGAFDLAVSAPVDVAFVLSDLYADAAMLDGFTLPVPPFGFTTDSDPHDLEDIDSATLAGGTLTVEVLNGLPVPISATGGPDRLVLDLVDPASGLAVVTVEFDPIAAGSAATESVDLAGVTLPGALSVRLAGGSPGSSGAPVLVDAAAEIAVSAVFSDLQVTAAEAVIGAQEFSTEFATDLPSDYSVERAVIGSGLVQLDVVNELPIPCLVTVTWPDVVDLDGQPMQLVVDLPGGASQTQQADFAGYVVQAPEGATLDQLVATVTAVSPGSGGLAVPVQSDQGVRADLGSGRIAFTSVTGVVPELAYDFDPMDEEIDLPDELEGLQLTRASLELELVNSAAVTAYTDFVLTGVNAAGQSTQMTVQEQIAPAADDRAAVTRIVLDETNSDIVAFLNNLPTSISLAGGVRLGGDGQIGTVRTDDYAVIGWRITSPVDVMVEQSQLFGDTEALDLDQDGRDMLRDHVGGAELQLEVLNHLPLGIEARVLFGTDSLTVKEQPLLAIGPIAVAAADVDPVTRAVSVARTSRPLVTVSAADVQLLATEGLLSVLEVVLPSTDGQAVRILTTDYVTVQGLVYLDVEVSDD
jgi:hypothetical protein